MFVCVMSNIDQFETKLKWLIGKVLRKRRAWEERRNEVERQIEILDSKLAAYQATLKDYWESNDKTNKHDIVQLEEE